MPNIATALKQEIARLARKELRAETASLKKAVSSHRSEIAALKRRIAALERGAKRSPRAKPERAQQSEEQSLRFRAAGLASHRQRLGLSAADAGKLLGVSALSVYKWESGKAKPRRSYMPSIAAFRTMGKREVQERLSQLLG